ncbi:MAG: pyridoxine 5'-phosphate synthase [Bacteroidota bacterium]
MTQLSVNINKIATLRNARGGDRPNVVQVAMDCERFGAEGITIHPRPDERHITTKDVYDLKQVVTTELNIEGYPDERFLKLVHEVRPAQATLVPDPPDVLTSNAGWDIIKNESFLRGIIERIQKENVRVSVFVDPVEAQVEGAKSCGADAIELYTESYARGFVQDQRTALEPYVIAANRAKELGLRVNAGHDLNLENLSAFQAAIPFLDEVSIGHALICDALYYGLENTIGMYKRKLS